MKTYLKSNIINYNNYYEISLNLFSNLNIHIHKINVDIEKYK